MIDELGGKIMKQFFGLKSKTYRHLKNSNDENKKSKRQKKVSHKKKKNLKIRKTVQEKLNLKRK